MPHNDGLRRSLNRLLADQESSRRVAETAAATGIEGVLTALDADGNAGLRAWLDAIPSSLRAGGLAALLDGAENGLFVELIHRPASDFSLEIWESTEATKKGRRGTLTLCVNGPSE